MEAVSNKDAFNNELIKLKETVDAGIPSRSSETPDHENEQPSDSLQIETNGESKNPTEGPKSQESKWMIGVRKKLDLARIDDEEGTWKRLCIYKVSRCLRDGIPNIVSLGPYHHGKERLRPMDQHKWRAFYQILKRGNQDAKDYLDSIRELETRARACYEGHINICSNEFLEMMVLDGCFVLELFRGASLEFRNLGYSPNDCVFAMRGSMHLIQRDMIMLENQIPLFILDRLLELQLGKPNPKGFVEKLALEFFDPFMPTEPLTKSSLDRMVSHLRSFDPLDDTSNYHHCLHVLRQSLLWSRPEDEWRVWLCSQVPSKPRTQLIHCVTELREAGIKFKQRKADCLWDIRFKNGVLEIPRLIIHDGTKSLFLNLIAFEQYLGCGNEITSYVIFMDNLINSQEDVGYLHYCGIFEHWLGSDVDVADMFNQLWQDVVFDKDNSYLSELSQQVNQFYSYKWNTWRASLMHNYFSNPWSIISLFAAVILLILTAAQTFYGVYGFYTPPS